MGRGKRVIQEIEIADQPSQAGDDAQSTSSFGAEESAKAEPAPQQPKPADESLPPKKRSRARKQVSIVEPASAEKKTPATAKIEALSEPPAKKQNARSKKQLQEAALEATPTPKQKPQPRQPTEAELRRKIEREFAEKQRKELEAERKLERKIQEQMAIAMTQMRNQGYAEYRPPTRSQSRQSRGGVNPKSARYVHAYHQEEADEDEQDEEEDELSDEDVPPTPAQTPHNRVAAQAAATPSPAIFGRAQQGASDMFTRIFGR